MRENSEFRTARIAKEEQTKADKLLAEKMEEEKLAKYKETPAYKKEQELILKKQQVEDRLTAERLKKEQDELEKRRVLEEKEQVEREKIKKIEAQLIRPLVMPNDPRIICQSKIVADGRFSILGTKISLTGLSDITFPMLSDQSIPTGKDQQLISSWADEFKKCISESSAFRASNYAKETNAILDKEDNSLIEAAIELYGKKITYGKFNQKVQQIAKESKINLDLLQQNLQAKMAEQQEAARMRAAAMRDAQVRQEQQRQADQRRQDQIRQAEQSRIQAARRQWEARCEFDSKNAYERYMKTKENDCNVNSKGLAGLCVFGVISSAQEYQKSAFASCMSAAPN